MIIDAAVLLPVLRLALSALGFRRVQRWVETRPLGKQPTVSEAEAIATADEIVHRLAARAPFQANCLLRSLTLGAVLRRQGIESELRIGVRRLNDRIEAHAWVERSGVVLNDAPDIRLRYRAFEAPIRVAAHDWR